MFIEQWRLWCTTVFAALCISMPASVNSLRGMCIWRGVSYALCGRKLISWETLFEVPAAVCTLPLSALVNTSRWVFGREVVVFGLGIVVILVSGPVGAPVDLWLSTKYQHFFLTSTKLQHFINKISTIHKSPN